MNQQLYYFNMSSVKISNRSVTPYGWQLVVLPWGEMRKSDASSQDFQKLNNLVFGLINLIKINEIVRYLVKIIVVFRKNKNKNLLYKTIIKSIKHKGD